MMSQSINILMFNECRGAHSHEYPQIMVPLQKSMRICIGEEEYEVTPQELCFIPKGMVHHCEFFGKMLALNLEDDIDDKDKVLLTTPIIVSMRGQIMQLVELIQAELKHDPHSKSVRFLYNFLYSKLMENYAPPSICYISEHYDLPITVEQLAEMESYNVTYFNDWFKQQTGVSPGLYLRKTRIDKAKELLENTGFGVTDIAVMVGYSSNSTFTRAFRSVTGITPKAYRERLHGCGEDDYDRAAAK